MKKSNFIKVLCSFLSLIIILSCIPLNATAIKSGHNYNVISDYAKTRLDEETNYNIVSEVESERTAYSKVYLLEDGSFYSITSSTPIHENIDGVWVDILSTNTDIIPQNTEAALDEINVLTQQSANNSSRSISAEQSKMIVESGGVSPSIRFVDSSNTTNVIKNNLSMWVKPNDVCNTAHDSIISTVSAKMSIVCNAIAFSGIATYVPIRAYEVLSPWNDTIDYKVTNSSFTRTNNASPTINLKNKILDMKKFTSAGTYVFNVTDLYNRWERGISSNNGVIFTSKGLGSSVFIGGCILERHYRIISENDFGFTYKNVDMGRAGMVKINEYTNTITLDRSECGVDGNIMPVNISRIFDLGKSYTSINFAGNGARWNYESKISLLNSGTYKWKNFDGSWVFFKQPSSENIIYDSAQRQKWYSDSFDGFLWINVSEANNNNFQNTIITDSDENTICFDRLGRVVEIKNKYTKSCRIVYNELGYIDRIVDGVGRCYKFYTQQPTGANYTCVTNITLFENETDAINNNQSGIVKIGGVNYSFNYKYEVIPGTPPFNFIALSNVLYPDGESVSYVYDYNQTDEFYSSYFDENDIQYRNTGRLIKIISNDETELIIKYADAESNRVESLLQKKGNATLQKIELDSHNTYQRIIKTNDVQEEVIQYNHNLDPLYRRDNAGIEYYYDYDSAGNIVQITLPENADNLLLNGNFEDYDDESWKPLSEDESYICPEDETSEDSNNWYYIKSDTERLCGIYQKIQIDGKLGDSFGISAFGMANEIIPIDTRSFGVEIFECDSNGTFNANEPPIYTLYFDTTISNELQYRLGSFTLEKDVENIAVCIVSSHQSNPVYVDNVKLYKASSSNIIDFDDAEDEEITSTCTCTNCKYEYDCLCDCTSEIDCTCVSCVTFSNSIIDANGNVIKNTLTDGTKTLESESTYTSNGNYICKEIDENGNEIIYTYNINNGTLEKITDANDIDGIGDINYTYNAMGVLVKVSQTISAAQEESYDVNYIYSNDKLTSINHNNATYVFEYDDFGNCIKTKIVDTKEKVYNETNYTFENFYSNATLNSITYSNGHKISYSYDDGNITAISFDNETTPRYEYNYDENGVVLSSKDNTTGISTIYTEDGGYSISRSDGSIIYSYGLNDDGLISENIFGNIYVNGNEEISPEGSYTYDCETGITQKEKFVDTPLGYHTHSIVESDTFERILSKSMLNENDNGYSDSSLNVSYTYHETDNQITKQISSMQNNYIVSNDSLYASKYDCFYDGCGNISMVNRYDNYGKPYEAMHTDSYEYDAAGQLIRENNYSKGTFVYSYDEHGNICEISKYSYTLEENLGEETDSTTFTYDPDWKDLLLYHNEKLITYDEMGNPLTYGNDDKFEWQGRLLKSYTTLPDPLDTSCDFKKYVFSYDGEGNRTVKTVYDIIVNEDGTMSEEKSITYYYLWEDNRLIAQQSVLPNGNISNTLKYLYDANNEAYGFVINNNNIIYYIKDNLGNVKSLFSKSNGEYAVNYYYDAWGNVSYSCNTSSIGKYLGAMVLAMNNSITYKGYCFDEDADLYYLGSRYYNSKWCRFLNPDIYYDTGNSIIGTNVFAYCNNNPVNYYDDTGTWAKDVHSGKNEPKIDGVKYGTYTWAKECGMNKTYAKYLADECNAVDNIFRGKSFMPYIGDQSWHFNTNAGTNKEDSRIINARSAKSNAIKYFAKAQNSKSNKDKKSYTKQGLTQLGLALHATQDIYAHTPSVCSYTVTPIYSQWGILGYIKYWSHPKKKNGVEVDSAKAHKNVIFGSVKNETKSIIKSATDNYTYLKSSKALW